MRLPFVRTLAGSVAPTPPTTDPNFENVTLLLHGDGTNGGQNNTFVDGSTNNFTITRNGNTTQGTFSPYGDNWSNYFDGNGDSLSVPDNAAFDIGTGDFTIEAWVFITGNSPLNGSTLRDAAIFGCYPTSGTISNAYGLFITGSGTTTGTGLVFETYQSGTRYSLSVTTTLAQNTWHHIAAARSGTTTKIFLNGSEVLSGTLGNQTIDSAYTMTIGRIAYTSYEGFFNGYISNLRVLKGTAQYTGSYTVPTAPLTAITNTSLLTCQSNRFRDASTNNFTITRNGDVSVQRFSPFNPTAAYAAGTIGGSGYFDGNGDYLSVASSSSLDLTSGNFTIELWVYPRSYSASNRTLVSKDGRFAVSYSQYSLAFSSTGIINGTVGTGNGTSYTQTISSPTALALNAWHHLAFVKNGTTLTLYVNGTSVASATQTGTMTTGSQALIIGWEQGQPTTHYTDGHISDLRIVKGTAVYTANFTPPTAPLSAVTNTQLLLLFQNAAIIDNAMMVVPETVGNAQISTTVKKYGTGSLAFDGTGDYLSAPVNQGYVFGTGDFTVEYWTYPLVNTTGCMVDLRTSESGNGAVAYSDYFTAAGKLGLYINAATYTSTSTLPTGQWTHIAVSRSGNSLRVFFNGVQDGATVVNSQNLMGGKLTVGINVALTGPFNGYLDDVRITKGVARYTANFTPPTAALPDL